MVTWSQSGIVKPLEHFSLHTASIYPIPKTPFVALQNSHCCQAMLYEYNALIKNGTWILVPNHAGVNMVRSMWLFKHKFHANGTLSRYKARLVANGSSQQQGIDVDETFSPIVQPATIRTVLSLAVSRKWPIHQLDVKNAFLNGNISETVYMHQPPGFTDPQHPNHEFDMTDLGTLNYFFGISAMRSSTSLFLSQKKYACELLEHANMVNCNPSWTPVDTDSKLGLDGVAICLYMHDQWEPHFAALKRILRYVQGTVDFGLQLYASATTSLIGAEAEYRGVANVVAETAWLRNLLCELHSPLSTAT
nr:ribonuclease H-like domain-containing protein [Tanacetum cinerariifolium]